MTEDNHIIDREEFKRRLKEKGLKFNTDVSEGTAKL